MAFEEAHAFNAPLRAVATFAHAGDLPATASFVEIAPSNLTISTLKLAEDGEGIIFRLWNTSVAACTARVTFRKTLQRAARCNLAERELESLEIGADGALAFPVRGREIVTLRVVFA